jgi:pimeloyl-ACP methyl ester carboxylesterase
MTLLDGITSRIIDTDRLRVGILERVGDNPAATADQTVILVHGNVSSSLFWQELMQDLPSDLRSSRRPARVRRTESAPVDATRGVRDFSDDVFATLQVLGIDTAHLVGWSMGGGVVMQYAIDHPVRSLTLQAPVSPYGFGGTRRDGSRVTADDAGCGAGGANPDFVQRLTDRDATDEAPTSPRSVFRSGYVAPGYERARGHLGRVDEHHLHRRATTPATASPARTGRVRRRTPGRAEHHGAAYFDTSRSWTSPQAARPLGARLGRRDRLRRLVLRHQPPRRPRVIPGWPGAESLPRRRWCRRPATCWMPTARREAPSPNWSSRASATRRTWSARRVPPRPAGEHRLHRPPGRPAPPTEAIILSSSD